MELAIVLLVIAIAVIGYAIYKQSKDTLLALKSSRNSLKAISEFIKILDNDVKVINNQADLMTYLIEIMIKKGIVTEENLKYIVDKLGETDEQKL